MDQADRPAAVPARRPSPSRQTADRLAQLGVVSATAEARLLLALVTGRPSGQVDLVDRLAPAEQARLDDLVAQRGAGVPLQHLTGWAHFRRISLRVGPGVFIPRPETEVMTGWAIERLGRWRAQGLAPRVVELCAGSGAISLALADEVPGLRQWAVERSPQALVHLRRNLAASAIEPVAGDMASALPELDGTIDLVLANPPYIPDQGRDLPVEVAGFDPPEALYAGPDGLAASATVAAVAARLLRPGGLVASEHDDDQGQSVPALFRRQGFQQVTDHLDWTGRARFVTAQR
ncbi:MAG: peptide chain release factor N(5)-glutamine methyltransferase [Propionibacteriaceae bacterium]|jgi:release factor glutamine methyltransferase|nr:peptide chain release factor N(5)-glutamine methyltransferase [Propionibacteriaceae bacterium]